MRRFLAIGGGVIAGLVIASAAAAMALMGTVPGHGALRRIVLNALASRVDGTVQVGTLGGSLWRSAALDDVRIADRRGRIVVRADGVRAGYALSDILRGRIVLRRLELIRPVVEFEQQPDGTWNYQHVFRLLDTAHAGRGPRPIVDLRDVTIEDGTFVLVRRPAHGATDTRRVVGVNVALRRLRLSDPDSTAILASIARLALRADNPRIAVVRGNGELAVDGDSLRVTMHQLAIGQGTQATAAGHVRWGPRLPQPAVRLAFNAAPAAFADLRGVVPQLPASGGGRLGARIDLLSDGTWRIDLRRAEVRSGRSSVRGDLRLAIAPGGRVTVEQGDLTLAPFDLAALQPYVDSLPVRGLVRGHVAAQGPLGDLAADLSLGFTDESPGAAGAASRVAARGRIGVGAPEGLRVRGLAVADADVALASVARFTGGSPVAGHLLLSGTFDGPWRQPSVTGLELALEDGTHPATRLHGRAVLDSARVLGADLTFDTLALAQLARLVPGVPPQGVMSGVVQVSGPLDSLGFYLHLAGAMGGATARGTVVLRDTMVAAAVDGTLDSLDASRAVERGPVSRLIGRFSGWLRKAPRDSSGRLGAGLQLALDTFSVEGVDFTRAGAAFTLDDQQVMVDSLWAGRPDLGLLVTGALGRPGRGARQVTFTLRADSLETLAPVMQWARALAARAPAADTPLAVPGGQLVANGRLVGTTAAFDVDATLASGTLRYDSMGARNLQLVVAASPFAAVPRFDITATADSAWGLAGRSFSAVDLRAAGSADTFAVGLAAGLERGAAVAAHVDVARDSTGLRARVDSLRLGLAGVPWTATRPFTVALTPDSIAIDSAELLARSGAGRLRAAGSLPRRAAGDFSLTADSVPLAGIYALLGRDTAGVGGYVDASARVTGSDTAPGMNLVLGLVDGRFGDYRAPLFQVVGRYEGRRLTFKGGLWRDTVQVLTVGASLPLDLSLTGVDNRKVAGEYAITASADSVDLALLNQVTSQVRDLRGRLLADVRLTGSWDGQRRVDGTIGLVDGAVTIPSIGKRYSDVAAQLALSDSGTITVQRMRLTSGGTLDVTGTVTLTRAGPPQVDLALHAAGFSAMDLKRFAGVTASGDLTLRGPALGALLRGQATVDAGYLLFTDLVEKRIVNLDDPEFRAIVDSSLASSQDLAPSIVTVFLDSLRISNLSLGMGRDVWLRSTEANIQLTGSFRISRSVEDGLPRYRLDGTLNANRGTYRLNLQATTKDFRVTHGEVRFFGTPDFNPEMDITAEHALRSQDGSQLVVRALIGGTLLAPRLTLESDQRPPLSETEIISYLLFGRPTFELANAAAGGPSGQQQILADAVSSLAGVSAGLLEQSLVSDLGLPIDYLTIRPGSSVGQQSVLGGARVEAGTQLGSRTFLTLNAGLCEVRQGQASRLLGFSLEYQLSQIWLAQLSYEPIVRQCENNPQQAYGNYQLGFDLFWQSGIR